MDECIQLFDVDELNALDAKQLEILRRIVHQQILNEIQTNAAVRAALKGRLQPIYDQLKGP